MVDMFDVAIIGGGIAGLSAAMYSGRFGLKTVVFDNKVGGTIILTDIVENYPGFIKLTGLELSDKIKKHAMTYKPVFISKKIDKIKKMKGCFSLKSGNNNYNAKAVILATGTEWRKLNVKGEKELTNKGVHSCVLCDGIIYKNKITAIIGGADSAVKEALLLSEYAKKVFIIYRGDKVHPEPVNLERMKKNKKIKVINNTNVIEILGKNKVTGIKLDKKYKNSNILNLDAVFIDVGHIPITNLAKELKVKLNEKGEVKADKLMQTSVKGFFVAGDVSDTPFKQAITAASEGCIAAYSAYSYVSSHLLCTYDDKPLKKIKK